MCKLCERDNGSQKSWTPKERSIWRHRAALVSEDRFAAIMKDHLAIDRLREKAREVVLQWQKVNNLGINIAGNDITHKFRTLIAELEALAELGKKEE
jgi:hypothetical protein